jgi:hypothetical protein
VGAVEAAPESEGAFGLDLEHDLPVRGAGLTTLRFTLAPQTEHEHVLL